MKRADRLLNMLSVLSTRQILVETCLLTACRRLTQALGDDHDPQLCEIARLLYEAKGLAQVILDEIKELARENGSDWTPGTVDVPVGKPPAAGTTFPGSNGVHCGVG